MVFGNEEPSDSGGSINHQDSATTAQQPMRCLADCGFFGSQQFQGYCSQCYVLCEIAKLNNNNTASAASQHTTVSIDNSIENATGQDFPMDDAINQSSFTQQQNDDSTTVNDDLQNNPMSDQINNVNSELTGLTNFDDPAALNENNGEEMSINKVQISDVISANFINANQGEIKFKSPSRSIVPESALINDGKKQSPFSPINDSIENKAKKEKPIQKDPSKCAKCNSRLRLTDPECSCGLRFCYKHRFSESHNCTFDYKSKQKDKLTKEIPKVSPKNIKDF